MINLLAYYWVKAPWTLVYMLQQFEYNPSKFAAWVKTVPDLTRVQQRGRLEVTARVQLMLLIAYLSWGICVLTGIVFVINSFNALPILLIVCAPFVCAASLYMGTLLLQRLVVSPGQLREIAIARKKLEASSAIKIAVMGSYGKTTMKAKGWRQRQATKTCLSVTLAGYINMFRAMKTY